MEFFKLLPIKGMNAICNLSNIMKLTRLVDLCCAFIFSLMENKTVKEFRQLFGVRDDRTKEEEDEFKKRIEFSIDASCKNFATVLRDNRDYTDKDLRLSGKAVLIVVRR
uniref:Skp1 domain-containing protein n=1 Tax=Panagrellus redivivus TaxID=6233 RepID=A0A7E4ZSS2_PANRE